MDFDIFKSEFLADRTLALSPAGEKGQSGAITLRFRFDQTRKVARLSSGLKDTFDRQHVLDGSYPKIKLLKGTITTNITPPSWTSLVTSLAQIAEVVKPIAELNSSAQVALVAVSAAIQIVVKQIIRDGRVSDLLETVAGIYDVLRDTNFDKIISFEKTFQRLLRATTECSYFIADYCKFESFVRRAVEGTVSNIDEIIGDFERRFTQLRVEFLMGSTIQVAQMALLILEKATNIETLLHLQALPLIKDATWARCPKGIQGVSTDAIDEIISWVHADSNDRVYLLLGDAQTGKSSIAHSISQIFARERRLGSSIFLSNNQKDTKNLASTMARELCALNQGIAEKIAEAISIAPALPNASLDRQFNELIVEPLKMLTFVGPIVVVVDGLDHCADPEVFETFLRHIPNFPPNFRFLLTSRLRLNPILSLFNIKHYRSRLLPCVIPLERVPNIADQRLGEQGQHFPSSVIDAACQGVIQKAESHPCVLSCILRALSSRPKQAAAFISQMASSQAELPPEFEYLIKCPLRAAQEVIARSPKRSHDWLLAFVVLASGSTGTLWPTLLSRISTPDGNDDALLALSAFRKIYQQTIHYPSMSYEEFLLSCQLHHRCVDIMDLLGSHAQHLKLLNALFAADMVCATNNHVDSLFSYLLEGWVDVVVQVNPEDEGFEAILDDLRHMFCAHLIKWVEAMKLVGWLPGKMINQLEMVFRWVQANMQHGDTLLRLAVDGLRFVQLYQRNIAKAPSRVLSLLKNVPRNTTLYQMYKTGNRTLIKGAKSQWPRFTYTLEDIPNLQLNETSGRRGVAYSPDGTRILAIQGTSVGIWDANSGTLIRERARMSNQLSNLVPSPDFTRLVVRDYKNQTIYRWELDDMSPPEHLSTGDRIYGSMHGYSSDGQIFFFCDGGRLHFQINGDLREFSAVKNVFSAAISPDNKLVAASCHLTWTRKNVFIFNIQTMQQVLAIQSTYRLVALRWSPCCAFLVGFEGRGSPIYIWDSSTGEQLSLINAVGRCFQLAISQDSSKLITASGSGIEIWDISNPSKPSRLELIPEGAHSVALSPDGARFVVGLYGPKQPRIRVYDVEPITSKFLPQVWGVE